MQAPNSASTSSLAIRTAVPPETRLAGIVAPLWQTLTKSLFDRYRPELHYMRGPGPKYREKHGAPPA